MTGSAVQARIEDFIHKVRILHERHLADLSTITIWQNLLDMLSGQDRRVVYKVRGAACCIRDIIELCMWKSEEELKHFLIPVQ